MKSKFKKTISNNSRETVGKRQQSVAKKHQTMTKSAVFSC